MPNTTPTARLEAGRVALFVDIENLVNGAASMALDVDLGPILEKLKQYGRVQIRRCYGDLKKSLESVKRPDLLDSCRAMLQRNLLQIEDIPYHTAKKNAADIRLALEALSVAYTNESINYFAIVGSDRDYIPLYNKLRELDKTIIVVAIDKKYTTQILLNSADRVFYYEDLFSTAPEEGDSAAQDSKRRSWEVLVKAIQSLEAVGRQPLGSLVFGKMQELQPDFELHDIGYNAFKQFAEAAQKEGLVKIQLAQAGGDILLALDSTVRRDVRPLAPAPTAPGDRDGERTLGRYRVVLADVLKNVALPSVAERSVIFDTLDRILTTLLEKGPVELKTLVDTTSAELRKTPKGAALEKTLFKMVLSLRYARCFYLNNTGEASNPEIQGRAVDKAQWDDKVVANFIYQIRQREGTQGQLDKRVLARLFYDASGPTEVQRIERLLEDVRQR